MPSTTDQLQQIARTLNGVRSAGQVRVAIGETLKALSRAYPLVSSTPNPASARKELDQARGALELWYPKITAGATQDYSREWAKQRHLVDRAYVAIAGVEGAADHVPHTSNWDILATSLKEAPAVFVAGVGKVTKAAGQVAAGVAKEAGNVAGAAAGGLLSGLGPVMTLLIVGGVILYLKKGSVLGAVLGKVGLG